VPFDMYSYYHQILHLTFNATIKHNTSVKRKAKYKMVNELKPVLGNPC